VSTKIYYEIASFIQGNTVKAVLLVGYKLIFIYTFHSYYPVQFKFGVTDAVEHL